MVDENSNEQYRRELEELVPSGISLPEDSLESEELSTAKDDESKDVPRHHHTVELEKQVVRQKTLANDETQQRIKHQQRFFYFALCIIGIPVIVASLGFGYLVWKSSASDVTYTAYFASVVAEVIGLSFILGNYFFPNKYQEKQADTKDNSTGCKE